MNLTWKIEIKSKEQSFLFKKKKNQINWNKACIIAEINELEDKPFKQTHISNVTYTKSRTWYSEKIGKIHTKLANINKKKELRHKYMPRIKEFPWVQIRNIFINGTNTDVPQYPIIQLCLGDPSKCQKQWRRNKK